MGKRSAYTVNQRPIDANKTKKNAQQHKSLGKYKVKPQRDTLYPL